MPVSKPKNNIKNNRKVWISIQKRNYILYWSKTMKFEWFSGIHKQNCNDSETI